jgi:hypothetical protein
LIEKKIDELTNYDKNLIFLVKKMLIVDDVKRFDFLTLKQKIEDTYKK